MIQRFLLALLLALAAIDGRAVEAPPAADDPVIEARLQRLSNELRCLVCQNETLADSRAELANDLRREIRGMMKAGKSDHEITEFLVARYGDFVLYRPPWKATTLLLWIGPFVFLVGGIAIWFLFVKRRQRRVRDVPLSAEEERRAEALLNPRNGKQA